MENKPKQTAVEWLIDELLDGKLLMPSLIEQAKEMEKQQIIDSFDCDGCPQPGEKWVSNGEQYYNETYGKR